MLRSWLRRPRALAQRVSRTNHNVSLVAQPRRATSLVLSSRADARSSSPPPLLMARSFQTTSVWFQREDDDDKATSSNPLDGRSDEEEEDWEELDWLEEDNDDDDDEEDEDEDDEDKDLDEAFDGEIDEEAAAAAAQYIGVVYSPSKVKKYSAELELDGIVISGGDFWTALDAAKGYDELVDLYCDLETPRNFPAGSDAAEAAAGAVAASSDFAASASDAEWEVPEVGKRNADIIAPIKGTYLTIDEVLAALEREKAIDVYTVDLAGKSSLADYMIFTTGRSQAHMRRMADMMIQSMKARAIEDEFDYAVEGRDCDDWMIADCNNIVVHFMREDTRRILNLEDHWENMVNDKHKILGDMDEDEYMDRFGTSELMEYLEDDDFTSIEDTEKYEAEVGTATDGKGKKGGKGSDVDWK